jgi:aminoglycoside phosphotransferase (APT) family kinase protein
MRPPLVKNYKENTLLLFEKLNIAASKKNIRELNQCFQEKKRFFNTVVKKGRKNLVLKARLQLDREVKRDLEREINLYRFLREIISGKKMPFPRVISQGNFRGLQWYLREFQPGKLAGQMDKDHGFRKEFLKKIPPEKFVKIVRALQNLDHKEIKKKGIDPHGGWWYWQDFNFYRRTFLKNFFRSELSAGFSGKDAAKKTAEILRGSKKFLDKEARHLSHGDLYPNNILVGQSGKISFLDWGLGNLNNQSFDVAFIYLNAWRGEKWREKFLGLYLEEIKNRRKFARLYRISLISLTIRFCAHCRRYLEDKKVSKSDKKKIYSIFANHLNILKKALYNPDAIL